MCHLIISHNPRTVCLEGAATLNRGDDWRRGIVADEAEGKAPPLLTRPRATRAPTGSERARATHDTNIPVVTMAILARVAPAPVVHASAARVRSRAARRGAILVPRAEGKASAKDVDWDAKTKELTAERIMEQCMEAMADGDEERLQECLLELEDPEETKQVIEKVSSKTDDEFWKAKLAEIAAERVLENCMSAVVRPHAARGRNRSRATTRATPKAKVSVARRISPNQRDPTTTDFFSPIPSPSPSRVRCPATRTRSRRACSTPTTTRSSGWTSPPRRTGPRPSVSRRRIGAECWWPIAQCK